MPEILRLKIILVSIWVVSIIFLVIGAALLNNYNFADLKLILSTVMFQVGCAFFFALSVGWLIQKIRENKRSTIIWQFNNEMEKAGASDFFATRKDEAESALRTAFSKNRGDEILIAGTSLRLFFIRDFPLNEAVKNTLSKSKGKPTQIKAVFCCPDCNSDIPARSFVEEYSNDAYQIDRKKSDSQNYNEFCQDFAQAHGPNASNSSKAQIINDLESSIKGVEWLHNEIGENKNSVDYRLSRVAPYCTIVIFRDAAYYTPNLLGKQIPTNLPLLVFAKSSPNYKKLVDYFKFLWQTGYRKDPQNAS